MTNLLDRSAILGADDLGSEIVQVPEWNNGHVRVRGLTAAERDAYEQSLMEATRTGKRTKITPKLQNAKARMAVLCIVDADGKRMFTDEDAAALGEKSASALNRIVEAIQKLSGMSDEDLEELEKNSGTGQSDDSSSS